jgi:hypothetical protein
MTTSSSGYMNWKAPAKDREWLIWPAPGELLRDTLENHRLLSRSVARVQNVPLAELRAAQRRLVGHEGDKPLIASGHQAELYHPGVWVKDVLADAVASKVKGAAFHFTVDTDSPKHLNLRWPGATIPLTDDPAVMSAEWSGLLACPSASHLAMIEREFGAAASQWNFRPMLSGMLTSLGCESGNLAGAVTGAQRKLDGELGVKHESVLVGPMLGGEPYGVFVHHVLSRTEQFAADYNGALREHRASAGITSATRPMPDLHVASDSIESPFWLDDVSRGTRSRAHVERSAGGWVLRHERDAFLLDEKVEGWVAGRRLVEWLGERGLRLSPRALTLTTFLRLMVADQFVHGIGGGRYDQVTDLLIARHFGMTPPRFAVTTATMFFPGALGRDRVCLNCLTHEGHRIRHGLLGERKRKILSEIEALPRRSLGRSMAFHGMHSALSAAAVGNAELRDWEGRREEAELRDREDEIIFDRELFYAIQSRERLEEMVGAYQREVGAG